MGKEQSNAWRIEHRITSSRPVFRRRMSPGSKATYASCDSKINVGDEVTVRLNRVGVIIRVTEVSPTKLGGEVVGYDGGPLHPSVGETLDFEERNVTAVTKADSAST